MRVGGWVGVLVSELCSPEGVLRYITVNVLLCYVRFPTGVEEKAGETGTLDVDKRRTQKFRSF